MIGISPSGSAVAARSCGGDHGQERVREHGQGDPPVPGGPPPDLVLVQAGQAFAGLEALLDPPALAGDLDQGGERHRAGGVAPVVGDLTGGVVAADQQPVLPGVGIGGDRDPGPRVQPVALGAGPGGQSLPRPGRVAARRA